jgi:hypothetical protein
LQQSVSDVDQEGVTVGVADAVVDVLEPVQVEQEQRDRLRSLESVIDVAQ